MSALVYSLLVTVFSVTFGTYLHWMLSDADPEAVAVITWLIELRSMEPIQWPADEHTP